MVPLVEPDFEYTFLTGIDFEQRSILFVFRKSFLCLYERLVLVKKGDENGRKN